MVEPDTHKVSRAMTRKKKPAPAPTPQPAAQRRRMSPVTRLTVLSVVLALAIDLAIAFWGYDAWIAQSRQMQLSALSQARAELTAQLVSERLGQIQSRLDAFAQTPQVVGRLARGNGNDGARVTGTLEAVFPDARQVAAIPAGLTTASHRPELGLSFAEMDMATRAEKGEDVFPEAARQNGQWRISFVSAVRSSPDAPIVGTLLLSLPADILQTALNNGSDGLGKLTLTQQFGERAGTLIEEVGQGEAGKVQTAEVPQTYLQVAFTPAEKLLRQTSVNLLWPLLVFIGVVILSLAAAVFVGRRAGQAALAKQPTASTAGRESAEAPGGGSASAPSRYEPDDILDIDVSEEDEALLGLEEADKDSADGQAVETTGKPASNQAKAAGRTTPSRGLAVPETIFRAYDIRGRVGDELTPELAGAIGQALGSEALDHGQDALVVARDARTHSPLLTENLVRGILSTGCSVINLGAVPTPLMYFATETLGETRSGVMVTASHNPAEFNGFKVVMQGKSRSAEDIQNIRKRILARDFYTGEGAEQHLDIVPQYIDTIFSDVALAGDVHLVVDACNGIAGTVAPRLFEELGCRVTPLYCEPDGTFPNHAPDPSVAGNLQDLVGKVQETGADLGVALDGDGDRLTVVSPKGEIIWADRLLLLFAKDIVARNPGADVVFDVKSTRLLSSAISSFGGRPIMWKTGHSPMRAKMLETGALLGGEFSGHIFIKDRWYGFDDGLYAAARLVEILSLRGEDLDTALEEFPQKCITPELRIAVAEDEKFAIVRQLTETGDFGQGRITTLDGLRADFPYGWGLLRASNTSADLTLRFEADTEEELQNLKQLFVRELRKARPEMEVNF